MSKRRSRLAQRRSAVGFTQEELAAELEMDVSAVKRWELGHATPSPRSRRLLAEVLEVSLRELEDLLDDRDSAVGILELASDQKSRIDNYKRCLQDAQGEILVSGTSLLHITEDSKDLLVEKIETCAIRMLIMDPDWIEENSDLLTFLRKGQARRRFRYEIDASIDRLHDLHESVCQSEHPFEVRSYRTVFPYIMTGYQSEDASCLVVEITDYIPSNERPRFTLVPSGDEPGLFEMVVMKFDELWNSKLVRSVI